MHEYFVRGMPDLCRYMVRTKIKGIKAKGPSASSVQAKKGHGPAEVPSLSPSSGLVPITAPILHGSRGLSYLCNYPVEAASQTSADPGMFPLRVNKQNANLNFHDQVRTNA